MVLPANVDFRLDTEVKTICIKRGDIMNSCECKKNQNDKALTLEKIISVVKPIAERYRVRQIYLFGSYARGEANPDSDLDFLVYGGDNFKLTMIFALAEELREAFNKRVDVFEIHEVNPNSEFYDTIMKERLFVA